MKASDSQGFNRFEYAERLTQAEISIVPTQANKLPYFRLLPQNEKGKATWEPFQSKIASSEWLHKWFDEASPAGIATVAGRVSGNLEIIDFDNKAAGCVFDEWLALIPKAIRIKLVICKTPSGGYHVRYRCSAITLPGNLTLAKAIVPNQPSADKPEFVKIIETRGEGGYALIPPSPGYTWTQGDMFCLADLTTSERKLLISAAKSFNQEVKSEHKSGDTTSTRPGDRYNDDDDFKSVLKKHGWECVSEKAEKELWKRPGTENPYSATFNYAQTRMFYVFSDNASPFEEGRGYRPFAVYTLLEHGGDFTAAARSLSGGQSQKQSDAGPHAQPGTEKSQKTQKITGSDRFTHLTEIARRGFERRLTADKVYAGLVRENNRLCDPPVTDSQLKHIVTEAKPKLQTITGDQLLAKELPPPKWAVEDWIPEGLTVFAGKPKIGKSFLMLGVCIAVACGGKALGEIDVEQGDAVYCALEDNERRLQSRLEMLHHGGVKLNRLHFLPLGELPRMDKGGLDMLDDWLNGHKETRLVVIDTLQRFKPHGNSNRNAYEEDYDVLGILQGFALSRGLALVVIHHMRKSDAAYELDEISGSTGITGAADSLLLLRRTGDGVELHRQGRDVVEETFDAYFDKDLCVWTLGEKTSEARISEPRQEIIELLTASKEPLTAKAVAERLDKHYSTTRNLMMKLAKEGLIIKRGTLWWVENPQPADEGEGLF